MIRQLFSNENGKVSSTRVVLMTMVALFCYIVISGVAVDPMAYTILNAVILLCLGGTTGRQIIKCMGDKNNED